jgi:HEAT repeat protein
MFFPDHRRSLHDGPSFLLVASAYMRPSLLSASALLRALRGRRGVLERLTGGNPRAIAVADRIAARPRAGLVPHLLVAFAESGDAARAVARALAACVGVASADDLLRLDEECRRGWWSSRALEDDIGPGDVARVVGLADDPARIAGVLSFHPDGHVRESAVKQLAAIYDGPELPFLLLRLNDWVDVVARQAEQAVRERMLSRNADVLVEHLPIVLRLETRRRRRHEAVVAGVTRLLTAPENRRALERGFASRHRPVRRTLYGIAFAAPALELEELIVRALGDEDTAIRLSAARIARRELSTDALLRLTPRLRSDPYPPVRLEWLAAAAERDLPGVDASLYEALVDRSRTARETARFVLRQHRSFSDFRSFYRDRIDRLASGASGAHALASAIAGLGESGRPEDIDVPIRLAGDARPAVRAACARAMALLDFEGSLPRLIEMLSDPSPGVTRAVRTVVSSRAGSLSVERIRRLLAEIPYVHGRIDAVRIAGRLGKWEAIVLLLESLNDPSPEVRDRALDGIRRWISRSNATFAPPTHALLERLDALLAMPPFMLGPGFTREIKAIARYAK